MKTFVSRGFKALMVTQFLGAFNDNVFRFVISALLIERMNASGSGTLFLALSGALFIFPFIVFSPFAGYLADRYSKKHIIVASKALELAVMILGFFALWQGTVAAILTVLFLMGVQSAIFSPAKYGILPEIVKTEKLSEANGYIQMWTYVAILLGQSSYGILMQQTQPHYERAAFVFMAVSVGGLWASRFVTPVAPSGSSRPVRWNVFGEVVQNIRWLRKDRTLFLSIVGLVYFGFLSGLFQLNVLLYARNMLLVDHVYTGLLVAAMTVGLGLGCFFAGKWSEGRIELGLVPLGAVGLSAFSMGLGLVAPSYTGALVCIFLLGISCGFYVVPLNALIQERSPAQKKGQVLATNNVLVFSANFIGSMCLFVMRDWFHLNAAQVFMVISGVTVFGTIYITRLLPYAFVRLLIWLLAHTVYRIKVVNETQVPKEGGVLLTPNHVSFLDAVILVVTVSRPVRFLVAQSIYDVSWLKPVLRMAGAIPVAAGSKDVARSLAAARQALLDGEVVCIFPEGQLSRTGNTLRFKRGFERVMEGVDCPIVPVYIDRIWGSIFSFERGRYFFKRPRQIPYPLTITYGTPLPSDSSAFVVRSRILEMGADSFPHRLADKRTLSEEFWHDARRHPFRFCMADSSGINLNYGQVMAGSAALASQWRSLMAKDTFVGVMLPPSAGGVMANIALAMLGKVPVNLNYTVSQEAMQSMIAQCGMKHVVTSATFLEKVNLDVSCEKVLIAGLSVLDRIIAMFKVFIVPSVLSHRWLFGARKRSMDELATVMFTSGSTGQPKGVMLTHANIISNLEGLYQVFHVDKQDKILGVLPLFHSFGFTATMWFPLISGMGAVYHYNPLDAKMVGRLVEKYRTTILMSTPTFLNAYMRRCTKEQFASLRIVVVGAEKLKTQIADAFEEAFGLDVMEGYGCTELSPIVSLNLPDVHAGGVMQKAHKAGKIGVPLPGIAVKVVDVNSGESLGANEDGLLLVKGPNVMKGYLNQPELTAEVMRDGWYVTGDVANVDEDGFIMITDRLSRFSKIAGEMVPHIKIEQRMHDTLNTSEQLCVVTSIPDDRKGEQLAVLCRRDVDVPALLDALKGEGLPNLWIPSVEHCVTTDAIPVLGSGKIDMAAVKRAVAEALLKR